jgi:hypothetical protein
MARATVVGIPGVMREIQRIVEHEITQYANHLLRRHRACARSRCFRPPHHPRALARGGRGG